MKLTNKLQTLYYQLSVFIITSHFFKIIFYFCYSNFLYFIYYNIETNIIILNGITDNNYHAPDIGRYAKIISFYFKQDECKQYYGSINKEISEILTSSFYLKYIINIEFITEFLETLNWSEIYNHDEAIILQTITDKYIDYFVIKQETYYDQLITPAYLENIKKDALTFLLNIFKNSKSLSIKTSPLITEEAIKHFLHHYINWDYYSKTEDCSSRTFGCLLHVYSGYVTHNVSINYPFIQLYNFLFQNSHMKINFYAFEHIYYITDELINYANKFKAFYVKYWPESLYDNRQALIPFIGDIDEHIISPKVLEMLKEEHLEYLKDFEKTLPIFLKIVFESNYIIIFVSFIPLIKISW